MDRQTVRLLAIVNGYDGNRQQVEACARYILHLTRRFAGGDEGEIQFF